MPNSKPPSAAGAERALSDRAARGDLDAFNQLVLMYQNLAYHHAYALLGDPALSEDATQESFIKAFENIGGYRGGSFRAWLLKIVTNSAYDLLRRSRRHPTQPLFPEDEEGDEVESPAWLADPAASVQATVEGNEDAKRLYQLIDDLPDVYRSVINLIDIHELDYTESARVLNVPLGTVKSRLARARLQLRERLEGDSKYSGGFTPATAAALRS
ncbi:MAG: sigma-70 family RNA polymerase sigma factor [Chloroflexota bacterium]|nr:sigma-70 family RNA polymerase sigma factor [Chloroflexota bacterium]